MLELDLLLLIKKLLIIHYEHRAQVFRQAVAALAEQAGVSLEGAL